MKKIGIDLGGTKIEGILLDENFEVIQRKRISTPQNDYSQILYSIVNLVDDLTAEDSTIGICTPGVICETTGLIKNSNTQCLIGKSFDKDLEKLLEKKITIENDANCFALAEAKMGIAKSYDVVFGVIMGTGVGGGIIIDGKIHHGRTNIAGEWGHHILHANGNKCYCGKNGCVETYLSGPSLEAYWSKISGKNKSLSEIVKNLDDEDTKQWKNKFLDDFGTSLANVIDILDPDVIVLGGGVSNIDFLYNEGRDSIYEKVFSDLVDTPILKNKLGDSAGVFGACLIS